jgi:L-alanine-DL-glutamate epimerase-like enolase superfamily enzyme
MKITSVDVIKVLNWETGAGGAPVHPICVRVNTDEGISGFGEAGLCYGNANHAAFGICIDFAELIIGKNPMDSEAIWNMLHRTTFWGMGGGSVIFSGISAIDIALWDIKGKVLNAPVYKILGGKTNKKLRAYASQLQFDWGLESHNLVTPSEYAEVTKKAMAEGYTCVKVDPVGLDRNGRWMGWSNYGILTYEQLRTAVERVAAMREAGGPELDIIIELHSLTDTKSAIQLGRELEQFRCFYYEEPTQPLNPGLFQKLDKNVKIPMATGERSYSRWGYRQFFEENSLGIIQPDLCNCGGISEGKKICDMAHVYDVGVQIHVCGSPISTAAALQVEAVIPNFVIHEHHEAALLPLNRATCKFDYQPVHGYFDVPDLPGIGQELTEKTIQESEVVTVTTNRFA